MTMGSTVLPKPIGLRQRRNRVAGATTLEASPAAKVPLPQRDRVWHRLTRQTWEAWWASPIAAEWLDADVPGLIETAQLVDDFWTAPSATERARLRAEIRLSSREYGLSSFSRRQLQWEVRRLGHQAPDPRPPVRPRRDPRLTLLR